MRKWMDDDTKVGIWVVAIGVVLAALLIVAIIGPRDLESLKMDAITALMLLLAAVSIYLRYARMDCPHCKKRIRWPHFVKICPHCGKNIHK